MEASALPAAPASVARISLAAPLLRLRSDEQLVAQFRAGNETAFAVIHDRYRQRLFAYTRQMLGGSRQDAEDALQDVFLRAYSGLRVNGRPVSLKAWLYRVAHNRCVDQLRRPHPAAGDVFDVSRGPLHDPIEMAERRDELRRLVGDVRRLPPQQRSVLLMREIDGLAYQELAEAHDVTVAAVKSLLVRARMGLVEAQQARDAPCEQIKTDLCLSADRGVRASGHARRHLRDCGSCRDFHRVLRATEKNLAALLPVGAGPLALLAHAVGWGGGGATAGGSAAAGAGAGSGAGAALGGTAAMSAGKVAAVVASAAVVSAGGAVEVKQQIVDHHEAKRAAPARVVASTARQAAVVGSNPQPIVRLPSRAADPGRAVAKPVRKGAAKKHHRAAKVKAINGPLVAPAEDPPVVVEPPAGTVTAPDYSALVTGGAQAPADTDETSVPPASGPQDGETAKGSQPANGNPPSGSGGSTGSPGSGGPAAGAGVAVPPPPPSQ